MSSIWRWCMHGLRGIRLEHVRAGRELRTSAEALDRFYQQLAGAYLEQPVTLTADNELHRQAEAELAAAGL